MINKANVTNASIESAGLPKDYKHALAEYIWNGFDAKASHVNVVFVANELGYLERISIEDNGEGIPYETLDESFGNFLDSLKKKNIQRSSYTKGKKGKGRFSFSLFATKANWITIYEHGDSFLEYEISIEGNKKEEYEDADKGVSTRKNTGTTVTLEGIFGITADALTHQEFLNYLASEFGWFLFLNKDAGYVLSVQNKPISYDHLILENDTVVWQIADATEHTQSFKVNYLRWGENIGDKYYYYYLNDANVEVAKELTSYNNNAIDFHHSVYVQSHFFNAFEKSILDKGSEEHLFTSLSHNVIYKKLHTELKDLLHRKQKKFIRERAAAEHLLEIEKVGLLPAFSNQPHDQERKKDLLTVIKELYCVHPRMLKGLKQEQEKTFIALLSLLLESNKRVNILQVIEQVIPLTANEKEVLGNVLKKPVFTGVT
ncbi:ATP-binding protein [Olivibacter sp. SDN3]|uniref:ATP-binding protein n=1 Tax=Olivibacter sp. SDN3 TaxID=2764720 RepID=UPI001650E061|nr:ATP-binding protein [Olivibacter sp. SDN3]QNL51100.1 ATP-binding protein [Olivibacter sp. SDN3]